MVPTAESLPFLLLFAASRACRGFCAPHLALRGRHHGAFVAAPVGIARSRATPRTLLKFSEEGDRPEENQPTSYVEYMEARKRREAGGEGKSRNDGEAKGENAAARRVLSEVAAGPPPRNEDAHPSQSAPADLGPPSSSSPRKLAGKLAQRLEDQPAGPDRAIGIVAELKASASLFAAFAFGALNLPGTLIISESRITSASSSVSTSRPVPDSDLLKAFVVLDVATLGSMLICVVVCQQLVYRLSDGSYGAARGVSGDGEGGDIGGADPADDAIVASSNRARESALGRLATQYAVEFRTARIAFGLGIVSILLATVVKTWAVFDSGIALPVTALIGLSSLVIASFYARVNGETFGRLEKDGTDATGTGGNTAGLLAVMAYALVLGAALGFESFRGNIDFEPVTAEQAFQRVVAKMERAGVEKSKAQRTAEDASAAEREAGLAEAEAKALAERAGLDRRAADKVAAEKRAVADEKQALASKARSESNEYASSVKKEALEEAAKRAVALKLANEKLIEDRSALASASAQKSVAERVLSQRTEEADRAVVKKTKSIRAAETAQERASVSEGVSSEKDALLETATREKERADDLAKRDRTVAERLTRDSKEADVRATAAEENAEQTLALAKRNESDESKTKETVASARSSVEQLSNELEGAHARAASAQQTYGKLAADAELAAGKRASSERMLADAEGEEQRATNGVRTAERAVAETGREVDRLKNDLAEAKARATEAKAVLAQKSLDERKDESKRASEERSSVEQPLLKAQVKEEDVMRTDKKAELLVAETAKAVDRLTKDLAEAKLTAEQAEKYLTETVAGRELASEKLLSTQQLVREAKAEEKNAVENVKKAEQAVADTGKEVDRLESDLARAKEQAASDEGRALELERASKKAADDSERAKEGASAERSSAQRLARDAADANARAERSGEAQETASVAFEKASIEAKQARETASSDRSNAERLANEVEEAIGALNAATSERESALQAFKSAEENERIALENQRSSEVAVSKAEVEKADAESKALRASEEAEILDQKASELEAVARKALEESEAAKATSIEKSVAETTSKERAAAAERTSKKAVASRVAADKVLSEKIKQERAAGVSMSASADRAAAERLMLRLNVGDGVSRAINSIDLSSGTDTDEASSRSVEAETKKGPVVAPAEAKNNKLDASPGTDTDKASGSALQDERKVPVVANSVASEKTSVVSGAGEEGVDGSNGINTAADSSSAAGNEGASADTKAAGKRDSNAKAFDFMFDN